MWFVLAFQGTWHWDVNSCWAGTARFPNNAPRVWAEFNEPLFVLPTKPGSRSEILVSRGPGHEMQLRELLREHPRILKVAACKNGIYSRNCLQWARLN